MGKQEKIHFQKEMKGLGTARKWHYQVLGKTLHFNALDLLSPYLLSLDLSFAKLIENYIKKKNYV